MSWQQLDSLTVLYFEIFHLQTVKQELNILNAKCIFFIIMIMV